MSEHEMDHVTLSVDEGALWRSDREHGRRLVATCVDMAERIAHRWNTWGEMVKALDAIESLSRKPFPDVYEAMSAIQTWMDEYGRPAIARAKGDA